MCYKIYSHKKSVVEFRNFFESIFVKFMDKIHFRYQTNSLQLLGTNDLRKKNFFSSLTLHLMWIGKHSEKYETGGDIFVKFFLIKVFPQSSMFCCFYFFRSKNNVNPMQSCALIKLVHVRLQLTKATLANLDFEEIQNKKFKLSLKSFFAKSLLSSNHYLFVPLIHHLTLQIEVRLRQWADFPACLS